MLEFEKPILELEGKIAELRHVSSDSEVNISDEISRMQDKADKLLQQAYGKLNAPQKVQVARHPERPHFKDYIAELITDFTPLAGDRNFAEDYALMGGIGRFNGQSCVIIGHEKGHDTESRIKHNFGMARPEGYRKAQRLMKMASQFGLPIYSVISPEGCASILWRSASHAEEAATALKLTAQDLLEMKLIDGVIEEPVGGAHRYRSETIQSVGKTIEAALNGLTPWDSAKLKQARREKFLAQGRLS